MLNRETVPGLLSVVQNDYGEVGAYTFAIYFLNSASRWRHDMLDFQGQISGVDGG